MRVFRPERVAERDRETVERALSVRYRPDDGHASSATLGEMLDNGRFEARGLREINGSERPGLLMRWPGIADLQFFEVPEPLWLAVDLPLVD